MKNQMTKTPKDSSLYLNIKLPAEVKRRLDNSCSGPTAALSKTGLVRVLLARYFDAVDRGETKISIALH